MPFPPYSFLLCAPACLIASPSGIRIMFPLPLLNFSTNPRSSRSESISYKVREAQHQKIPLIITVGEKEEQSSTVAVRTLDNQVKFNVPIDEFTKIVAENIMSRKLKIMI